MPHVSVTTTVEEFGPAAAIFLTDEQAAQLSTAKTPPVVVSIGGRQERLRISRMGGRACIGLSRASRDALGVEIGDEVDVTVSLDDEERTVEVPPLLAEALAADPDAAEAFRELSLDPPIPRCYATPCRHTGIADHAQGTPGSSSRASSCRCTHLVPLAARPIGGARLSYSRRKEMARSFDEAKREDTQQRRLAAVLADLAGR